MKLFLSWSGNESRQLATIFKEWLPNVLQYVEPYMSANDISLGERWNNNITGNLEESVFGLIFVTPTNINAPWINYEAGALAKTLDSKVVPILYHADVMILNEGPLKQFQSAKNLEKDSVFSLMKSINSSKDSEKLDETRLEKAFEMWWPDLEISISSIVKAESANTAESEPTERELLSVIYSKVSEQERFLKMNPVVREKQNKIPENLLFELHSVYETLVKCRSRLEGGPYPDSFFEEIDEGLTGLKKAEKYLARRNSTTHNYQMNVKLKSE